MIDLIVAITIIAGLTSSMVYSVSTFTRIMKTRVEVNFKLRT